ncbi:major capsid protein [Escherichia coli]|nr:major capsid protein [Escherichia coli]MDZ9739471.1 major capsid protein [Escherichia coli]MEA0400316.1 major capsid protein [Escherichia coli]MEA0529188.1 major capsid protein [Escherichia coli]
MYFTKENLATNARMQGHWNELWAQRNIFNAQHDAMIAANKANMTSEMLACNAVGGFAKEFWKEIDNQIIELNTEEIGIEIVNDLMAVQTVLPIGKTLKMYSVSGDINDEVVMSMDGQAPHGFDHTEYGSDGDPIPMFAAGYGVNWRLAQGLNTVGIDLALDSQRLKLKKFNKARVQFYLNGNENMVVDGHKAMGIKNHKNTQQLNLTTNLTTATFDKLIDFFTIGEFGVLARNNFVAKYDVMWVSPEIMANLARPHIVNGAVVGSVLQTVMPFAPVGEIRQTFALKGNEIIAYQRRRDVISPLIGMTTGVVPVPRTMPTDNYNFKIMSAEGLQITCDMLGRSGVVYGHQ